MLVPSTAIHHQMSFLVLGTFQVLFKFSNWWPLAPNLKITLFQNRHWLWSTIYYIHWYSLFNLRNTLWYWWCSRYNDRGNNQWHDRHTIWWGWNLSLLNVSKTLQKDMFVSTKMMCRPSCHNLCYKYTRHAGDYSIKQKMMHSVCV